MDLGGSKRHSFLPFSNKYFWNIYCVPGTTLGGGDTVKNKANEALVLVKMTFSKGTKK